jgi:hypothetical protein
MGDSILCFHSVISFIIPSQNKNPIFFFKKQGFVKLLHGPAFPVEGLSVGIKLISEKLATVFICQTAADQFYKFSRPGK